MESCTLTTKTILPIDALIDYIYGLNEGKINLTESLLRNVIRESINRILNVSQNLVVIVLKNYLVRHI